MSKLEIIVKIILAFGIAGCNYNSYCNGDLKEIKRIESLDTRSYLNWVYFKINHNSNLKEKDKKEIIEIYEGIEADNLSEKDNRFIKKYNKNQKKILNTWNFFIGKDVNKYFPWINFKKTKDIDKIFLNRYLKFKKQEIKNYFKR